MTNKLSPGWTKFMNENVTSDMRIFSANLIRKIISRPNPKGAVGGGPLHLGLEHVGQDCCGCCCHPPTPLNVTRCHRPLTYKPKYSCLSLGVLLTLNPKGMFKNDAFINDINDMRFNCWQYSVI
jgi:hypothetical protein